MNSALAAAWQYQPLASEKQEQAVMETICAYYFSSLMINVLTGRQLSGDFLFFSVADLLLTSANWQLK